MNDNHSYLLSIPMTPPSANVLLRLHWAKRKKELDCWHNAVWALCNYNRVPPMERCKLIVDIYFSDKRKRDLPNYLLSLDKTVADGLVRCGILPDDSPDFLEWGEVRFLTDRDKPRTEVRITPEK